MRRILLVSLGARPFRQRLFSTTTDASKSFSDLGVDAKLVSALSQAFQIHTPTAMQCDLLRHTLDSPTRNLLVRQPTGSGKTLALALILLTLALRDHQALTTAGGLSSSAAFSVQAANSIVVVPNRELAFQIEDWVVRLLAASYPDVNRHRVVGRFVSGAPYETQQRGTLKRHGVPAILVGTPRSLLELAYPVTGDPLIQLEAPHQLKRLATNAEAIDGGEVEGEEEVEALRGVRRLVLDEVDGMLRLPNRHATERQKKLRRDKPKPGQVFVDRLLETLGITQIAKRLRPPPAATPPPAVSRARVSGARGWNKPSDIALAKGPPTRTTKPAAANTGTSKDNSTAPPLPFDIVGPRSLQIIALSATANKDLRNWMVHRGWMLGRPLAIDNASMSIEVPAVTTHHCLVIENDRTIRNLREKLPTSSPIDENT
ncbi:hypothetical protein GGI21_004254, partial [Coemansia aciculifera]